MKTSFLPRRFLYIELLMYSLICTLLIIAWVPAIISLINYGTVFPSALRAAGFMNFTGIALLVFIRFVKKELRSVRFRLSEKQICFQTASRERGITTSSITSISLLRFPFGGGIAVIESSDGSLSVPLAITDRHGFFSRLCEYLTVIDSPAAERTDWKALLRTCMLTDISAQRAQKLFNTLLLLAITALPLNMFIGAAYWNMSIIPLILWSVAGTLVPLAAYTIADIILRLLAARTEPIQFSETFTLLENRVLARVGLVCGMLYLTGGILFRIIIL